MPIIVDKEKKRHNIIEAAITVFSRTGYRRTKISDIAEQAGVGKGTLYEYFRSKEDLFLQMSEYLFERYVLNQRAQLNSIADPEEQVRTFIYTAFEQATMWVGIAYLYIDIWSEMDRKGEEDKLRELMERMLRRIVEAISGFVVKGQEHGVFRNLNSKLAAHILLATLDGLVFQLLIDRNIFDSKEMADTLADMVLDGLRKHQTND